MISGAGNPTLKTTIAVMKVGDGWVDSLYLALDLT